jgi:hypothetical protein
MNEEFALLKSMIPACSGEMHKLAILQVSRSDATCWVYLRSEKLTPDRHL